MESLRGKTDRIRRPFNEGELTAFFGSPLYRGSKSRKLRFEPGKEIIKDSDYWIPLIGYFTGARLGEIVQLEIGDVELDDPIPHFVITDAASNTFPKELVKRVKSPAAVRRIPIHPQIIQLGFGAFVQFRRKQKRERLFYDIRFGRDGQASTVFSKRFARMLDKVGLQDPALVFHSFRHGMEDALRNARQPQYVIDRIIGHSDRSVSAGYGEGVNLEVAQEAIQDAVLPVNIVELLGRQPCS